MNEKERHAAAASMVRKQFAALVGRKIRSVTALSNDELDKIGMMSGSNPAIVLELDNGWLVLVTADPEGNGPGWLEVINATEKPG